MEPWLTDRGRLLVLIAGCAALWSLETLLPLFRYRSGRWRRATPNLALAAAVVLTNLAFASMTAAVSAAVVRNKFGLLAWWSSRSWVLALAGVAGLDLLAYFAHVLLHKFPLGWRFHRVHHSEMEVDVTTAFRQHPGETIWRVLWQTAGAALFGLPFWVVALYSSVSSLNAMAEHANIKMGQRADRWLRLLMVTPNMHKIHHSRVIAETDSNYSNIFSVWDRLFRTHTASANWPELNYGLDGFDQPQRQTLAALIRGPFHGS